MSIFILSCGVFEPELNKILIEIKEEKIFDEDIDVKYLPFGLHSNLDKLKSEIVTNLDKVKESKIILLYGNKCHYKFYDFLKNYDNVITFDDANCMELIIKDSKNKKSIIDDKNLYITPGWVLKFDELNNFINAVDMYDIRQQYGQYENIIIGDTKVCNITDDMIFNLFEKIQVPIDVEDVDINNFKNKIINALKKAL
ncbi:DUF1638 domain-containing protein [Romboutsia ilealis]|uniref:DUF1638 domain-containing protein n=1 Tax=Romboutsia faecis TaxID=2764597 RepID=A0ABR7JRC9_9FIRM|nr:DUF1638 domain-containing protein [Romboutsia faecis]MBC5997161.1 DUF1638 domain-containing protein [Romboutsia faecis]MRN23443.1 DUF1638 domain-containing protein [Romboutsia ilealis]